MDSSFSLTRTLKSFEGEWESSLPASIDAHVEAMSADRRVTLLQELTCIDMEFPLAQPIRFRNSGHAVAQKRRDDSGAVCGRLPADVPRIRQSGHSGCAAGRRRISGSYAVGRSS
jgi:hypothetical protein